MTTKDVKKTYPYMIEFEYIVKEISDKKEYDNACIFANSTEEALEVFRKNMGNPTFLGILSIRKKDTIALW